MSFVSKRSAFTPARCGVRAIGRPCQTKEPNGAVGLPFPRNPICQSKGEAIYVIDDDSDFLAEVAEQLDLLRKSDCCELAERCFDTEGCDWVR